MELASYKPSGKQSFEVGPWFGENMCTLLLGYTEYLWWIELHNAITSIFEF